MTRDEAIAVLYRIRREAPMFDTMPSAQLRTSCAVHVDAFAALGMLVLDEPKSVDERIATSMEKMFSFTTSPREAELFRVELAMHGLEIVEVTKDDPMTLERG